LRRAFPLDGQKPNQTREDAMTSQLQTPSKTEIAKNVFFALLFVKIVVQTVLWFGSWNSPPTIPQTQTMPRILSPQERHLEETRRLAKSIRFVKDPETGKSRIVRIAD
jgi:hypothetical protein